MHAFRHSPACALWHGFTPRAARQQLDHGLHACSAASLALEAAQHKAVATLAAQFASLTSEPLGKKWYTHFEAWLFARRGDGGGGVDGRACMLPAAAGPAAIAAGAELQRKLLAAGVSQNVASDIVTELGRLPARLAQKVRMGRTALQGPQGLSCSLR